jgi:hypothetical protein
MDVSSYVSFAVLPKGRMTRSRVDEQRRDGLCETVELVDNRIDVIAHGNARAVRISAGNGVQDHPVPG